jgi:predicted molibdopterin-dependent oxidoreductase YjgC
MSELTKMADVVLPGANCFEKNGTVTNEKGRVQRIKHVLNPPQDAKADWKIIKMISEKLGEVLDFYSPKEIFTEMVKNVESFSGLEYDKIGKLGAGKNN